MNREDLIGVERAPKYVVTLLTDLGGLNPFGEPNLRYVLAQNRVCKQAGEWHDWPEGLSIQERGGFVSDDEGNMVPSTHTPKRIVKEMRTIPRYPLCRCKDGVLVNGKRELAGDCEECGGMKGWILEKWWPRHLVAGTLDEWYSHKVPGTDLPRLGPYPEQGVYRQVAGTKPVSHIPPRGAISGLVAYVHYCNENSKLTPAQFARQYELECEAATEKAQRREDDRNREMMREALDPMLGSSLAAGREREVYAKRLRERGVPVGHVGA